MSYEFDPKRSLLDNACTVAAAALVEGQTLLGDSATDQVTKVHEIRKYCKKIRGLIRLLHPDWTLAVRSENEFYRDTAMALSEVRDAHICIESFDQLPLDAAFDFSWYRDWLVSRVRSIENAGQGLDERLTSTRERFTQAQARLDEWPLDPIGSVQLQEGFHKILRRVRRTMTTALEEPTTNHFHEWRKSVKNHYYHVCLLEPLLPEETSSYKNSLDKLTDLLGNERDLFTLSEALSQIELDSRHADSLSSLEAEIQNARSSLRAQARNLGEELTKWNPVPLLERVHYWWGVEATWKS